MTFTSKSSRQYCACRLSSPKPLTTYDMMSSYIIRHLRRDTKRMRRKQRKLQQQKLKPKKGRRRGQMNSTKRCQKSSWQTQNAPIIDVSGLEEFIKRQPHTRGGYRRTNMMGISAKRKSMEMKRRKHSKASHTSKSTFIPTDPLLCRDLYNDVLVNMLGPQDISGLSTHLGLKAALHVPQRFRESRVKVIRFPSFGIQGLVPV